MIPLHQPFLSDNALSFIEEALVENHLSGNGKFTKLCQDLLEKRYGFKKCLLTNSCTSALEMAAILIDIQPGDEVIVPSYTFVSSVNPFVMRGAKIVFADSECDTPNIDAASLAHLITDRTKAIVVVHYAGMSCDMETIMELANSNGILVIEDAAHALGATWHSKPLGGIGHLGAFSFHATKNIGCGEGGMLMINSEKFIPRAEILWEKGTNRQAFIDDNLSKYEWHDVGSSFYPSELTAAFLWAQLQSIDVVNVHLMELWNYYRDQLDQLPGIELPKVPTYSVHNAHLFYLKMASQVKRDACIHQLKKKGISAAFHYLALHKSPFWKGKRTEVMPNSISWEQQIVRIPLYFGLTRKEQDFIIETIKQGLN